MARRRFASQRANTWRHARDGMTGKGSQPPPATNATED